MGTDLDRGLVGSRILTRALSSKATAITIKKVKTFTTIPSTGTRLIRGSPESGGR